MRCLWSQHPYHVNDFASVVLCCCLSVVSGLMEEVHRVGATWYAFDRGRMGCSCYHVGCTVG
jgi:hypothetical protein